jgi:DNA-binding NtrC family response regulator
MQLSQARLLIVDDDVDVLSAAKLLLKRHVKQVDIEKNPEKIPFLVTNGQYDIILLDMNFTRDVSSGREGFQWLDRILDIIPKMIVVMVTAYGDVEMAVRAMKAGAADFVLKPWENDKLLATLAQALESKKGDNEEKQSSTPPRPASDLIAQSASMQQIFDTVDRVAPTDANVLVLGENGTGKTQLARHS